MKLRNTVYNYFIDLGPSLCQNAQLLQVNRQIRSEFGSLYLNEGNATVPFDRLIPFLRYTFHPIASQKPIDFTCSFRVELSWSAAVWHESRWILDLREVVSVMREHPLLNIEWDLNAARSDALDDEKLDEEYLAADEREKALLDRLISFTVRDLDLAVPVRILRNMKDEVYAKVASVELYLSAQPDKHSSGLLTCLHITLKDHCTEQEIKDSGLGDCNGINTECGGIRVCFHGRMIRKPVWNPRDWRR
ncbi:hypothetical protein J4E89_006903 [Alternaria sp. Ai002NY15]|nr:hypothetical protein J4E89_006903 [Alternaria sp. Ai002NY15]